MIGMQQRAAQSFVRSLRNGGAFMSEQSDMQYCPECGIKSTAGAKVLKGEKGMSAATMSEMERLRKERDEHEQARTALEEELGQVVLERDEAVERGKQVFEELKRVEQKRDDLARRYHALASEMVYEGNSVQHWRQKAKAYKECAGAVSDLKQLVDAGTPAEVVEAVQAMAAHVERLKPALEDRSMTNDPKAASEHYWQCADEIEPHVSDGSLTASVVESFEFLLGFWLEAGKPNSLARLKAETAAEASWHEPTVQKVREMCEGLTGNQIRHALDGMLEPAPTPGGE